MPFYANALVITDVVSINRNLANEWISLDFDLTKHGYNHETDTIKLVTMSYNFREIVEYDDINDESSWESVEIGSMLFDRRSYFRDVSTETFTNRMSWEKTDECQLGGYDGEPCLYNLDLFGNTSESIRVYTDNLWFGEGVLSVEVDRVAVPEPSSILLLCLGLAGLGMLNYSRKVKN